MARHAFHGLFIAGLLSSLLGLSTPGSAAPGLGVRFNPGTPGPFPFAVEVIDEGCDFNLAGSIDWSDPDLGAPDLVPVAFGDSGLLGAADDENLCPGEAAGDGDDEVYMRVRVHYPGQDGQFASGGPFPLVMILHGQQDIVPRGFEGYDYLGRHLASHGYVVASIEGRSLLDASVASRGEHIREHLRRFVARNAAGSGSVFEDALDLDKVTLVGHSRGGEAIVAAWEWQRVEPDAGYDIAALVAIGPTLFFGTPDSFGLGGADITSHLRDVAYQVVQGTLDCQQPDFDGLKQYDRAADIRAVGETPKSMVFIRDANHNFFNSVWESENDPANDAEPAEVLDGTQARAIAKAYIHAFLDVVIRDRQRFRAVLTGEARVHSLKSKVTADFQAPGSQFISLDDFEELPGNPHDPSTNSSGGPVVAEPAIRLDYDEQRFASPEGAPRNSYKGETYGGHLRWQQGPGWSRLSNRFPAGSPIDAQQFGLTHFSFRAGQIFREPASLNSTGRTPDFFIRFEDATGRLSRPLRVRSFAKIHPPFPAICELWGEDITKTVMSAVRIPLAMALSIDRRAIQGVSRGIDRRAIQGVSFFFPPGSEGEIVIDDLRFTQ